ncbi:UNVERIFIED_CONTAM: Serine carboxypeptidase-like 16 [Sesamum radiatum]|uniref:Serine carboxypeptidase-like 16 n=1 Tax=Sesamum radiatum TaxID=300843 RepID=A0AAW2P5T1_SESRA
MKHYSSFHLLLCLLLLITSTASSQSIINTLPGFPGILPFKLETGYIGVGEDDEVQLFYYFIESEDDPKTDPLMLWITGGPGCSGFSGLVYEIGPLAFDIEAFDGSFPSLVTNPYSWTKFDSPVGTGFSYATTPQAYNNSDTKSAEHNYSFLRKCTSRVDDAHILEPKCKFMSPRPNISRSRQLFLEDDPIDLLSLSKQEKPWCRNYNYVTSYVWANNETVQEALQIRQGTKSDWKRCNKSLTYDEDVSSVFKHHQLLSDKGFQALAYSGDHDMLIPYMSTLKWIRGLNLTLDDDWRPWTVDGQVAGMGKGTFIEVTPLKTREKKTAVKDFQGHENG